MVPKGRADAFVEACRTAFALMYPHMLTNGDYTAIINERHYERLQAYLKDARERARERRRIAREAKEARKAGRSPSP